MIEVSHISKRYADTVVVDDVSLTLPAGGTGSRTSSSRYFF